MRSTNEHVGEEDRYHPGCNDTNSDKCGNPESGVGCRGDKYATVEEDEAELGEAQGQWLYHEEDIFNLSQC